MGLTLAELAQKGQDLQSGTKKFDFSLYSWKGSEDRVPVPHRNNVKYLVDSIIEMNKRVSYVSVLLCGKSGSGKTSAQNLIAHRLHKQENYTIKWFSGSDIADIDNIVKQIPKNSKTLMMFDDLSYVMELMDSPKARKKLANSFTTLRHKVSGSVICMFAIHFLTALAPIMRDADFSIMTSMSSQDQINFEKILGKHNKYRLDRYKKLYFSQMQRGYFYLGNNPDKMNKKYEVDKPFRCVLVNDISGLHYVLMPRESCNICSEKKTTTKKKISAKDFYADLKNAYRSRGKTVLAFYAYYRLGRSDILPSQNVRALKYLDNMFEKYDIDLEQLSELAAADSKMGRKKVLPLKKRESNFSREQKLTTSADIEPDMTMF